MEEEITIEVIEKEINEIQIQKLIPMIKMQLYKDESSSTDKKIEHAVRNAFKKEARSVFFICYIMNYIVGFAFGNVGSGLESGGDYFWINELYIEENNRKKGFASKILMFIETWAKERNIKHIACITGDNNENAKRLYKKNKYEISSVVWVDKDV